MRVTYDAVLKLATLKGLEMQRVGDRQIDIWVKGDDSTVAECASVNEAYNEVYNYEPGKGL